MDEQYNELTESIEQLGRRGFQLIQSRDGYRYGEDTVLLSHFASLQLVGRKRMVRAVELGANNGVASLLLLARRPNFRIIAIEKQRKAFELLVRNVNLNQQNQSIVPVLGDVREIKNMSEVTAAESDFCFCNPPYFRTGSGPVPVENSTRIDWSRDLKFTVLLRISCLPQHMSCGSEGFSLWYSAQAGWQKPVN